MKKNVEHDDSQVCCKKSAAVVCWAQIEAELYFHAENIYLL